MAKPLSIFGSAPAASRWERRALAKSIPSSTQTKQTKQKGVNILTPFVFGYYGANSVCRHKCPKTKLVDLSTFCVAKFVRAPAASGKGTTSDKRVNPSTLERANFREGIKSILISASPPQPTIHKELYLMIYCDKE